MGPFELEIDKDAEKDLQKLFKSGRKTEISKVKVMLEELTKNPRFGVGNPERMKRVQYEIWSRRINKKDRLVYQIKEEEIVVLLLSALGHYSDK